MRDSSTENSDSIPTVVMDQLLGQNGSLFVAKSTPHNIIFKEVWVADDNVDEVLNERATFDELYRYEDAADFLVGYVGFFESTLGSHYCLVTEAGEAVADWTRERCVPRDFSLARACSSIEAFFGPGMRSSVSSSSSTAMATSTATWRVATSSRRPPESASSTSGAPRRRKATIASVR